MHPCPVLAGEDRAANTDTSGDWDWEQRPRMSDDRRVMDLDLKGVTQPVPLPRSVQIQPRSSTESLQANYSHEGQRRTKERNDICLAHPSGFRNPGVGIKQEDQDL